MPASSPSSASDRPILLVYAFSLHSHDGTTVQLRRLLADFPAPVWHVHGDSTRSFPDLPGNCVSLPIELDSGYPFRRGARFLRRMWGRFRIPRFVRRRLQEAVRQYGRPAPDVAYVVVYDESHAEMARAILKAANVDRYVLHMMDLLYARFDPALHPALASLIREASGVFVVSPRLAEAVAVAQPKRVEVLPLATGYDPPLGPLPASRPHLLMSGALYPANSDKTDFLNQVMLPAWLELVREMPGIEWWYSGADIATLSAELQAVVRNCGLLPHAAWCEALATSRCALLPVVHSASDKFRFSVPSRLVDYLAAGVPVVAPASPETATGDFLEAHLQKGVNVAGTKAEVYSLLKRLFSDDAFHRSQSIAAQSVAPQFSVSAIRQRVYQALRPSLP